MKVFLGGTCNGSKWRDELIPQLKIDYFNPVVDDWNEEAQKREIEEREKCDIVLYVITPLVEGYYAVAEAADDSNKRPDKTVFAVLESDSSCGDGMVCFKDKPIKSLDAVGKMVVRNGGGYLRMEGFHKLSTLADSLNALSKEVMDEMSKL